jgi:hypothetical protein
MLGFPIGGGDPYLVYATLGPEWLLGFCLIAVVFAYVALVREDRLTVQPSRKTVLALELGLVSGSLQWVLVRSGTWSIVWLLLKVGVWATLAWGYTMWRAGRKLQVPDYLSGELARSVNLVPAICFVIAQLVRPAGSG